MTLRGLFLAMALALAAPSPVQAQEVDAAIMRQLRAQGFDEIRVTRTLLGRTRIEAESDDHLREIIINIRTGEILRDYWIAKAGGGRPGPGVPDLIDPSRGSAADDDDDVDDDVDDDDDDDDDGDDDDDDSDDDDDDDGDDGDDGDGDDGDDD